MASESAEHQEFDDPKTCEKLICNGRPCAKCHMCRDWHFTGDYDTWTWITNWENWTKDEWNRFRNDGIRNNFKERDGATCNNNNALPTTPIFYTPLLDPAIPLFFTRDAIYAKHLCICDLH
ncbi:unnamed protein product [Adineta steineri]|uniref:Uncharacterized protein n=1 Tax=Adineta steineri TaxID=433720 RepID=A0A819MI22_9BILA|nr:unnamed protein product [Adineta steineri]